MKKAAKLYFLLNLDGFNPILSRKVSNTDNTKIIKYDLNLLTNSSVRKEQVKFINNTIGLFLTHEDKVKKLKNLTKNMDKKKNKIEGFQQPVVNVGMVGLN